MGQNQGGTTPVPKTTLEDVPGLETLDWSTPSDEQIEAWNKEYGEKRVKFAEFPLLAPGKEEEEIPIVIYYRTLKRSEYRKLVTSQEIDPDSREDEMCQLCTLWPQNIQFKEMFGDDCDIALLPTMLIEYIMGASGGVPATKVGNALTSVGRSST